MQSAFLWGTEQPTQQKALLKTLNRITKLGSVIRFDRRPKNKIDQYALMENGLENSGWKIQTFGNTTIAL